MKLERCQKVSGLFRDDAHRIKGKVAAGRLTETRLQIVPVRI